MRLQRCAPKKDLSCHGRALMSACGSENSGDHAFHVRRKETAAWQTEPAVDEGNLPKPDDVIEANLRGEMVKARVLVVITPPPGREGEGDPAVEVHAAEI